MRLNKIVEERLRVSRQARNSDRELQAQVLEHMGFGFTPRQREMFLDVNMETIRRIRQKYQESGMYQADQKISKERHFKGMQMQQIAPKAKPEYIQKVMEWGQ